MSCCKIWLVIYFESRLLEVYFHILNGSGIYFYFSPINGRVAFFFLNICCYYNEGCSSNLKFSLQHHVYYFWSVRCWFGALIEHLRQKCVCLKSRHETSRLALSMPRFKLSYIFKLIKYSPCLDNSKSKQ